MSTTRRDFVSKVASAAALAAAGIGTRPSILTAFDEHPHAGDPILKELAAKALEAAKAAGATYADVRFTLTRSEEIWFASPGQWGVPVDDEHAAVGVRVLANGAWGFAASNVWEGDEVARLGREAAVQAKTNAQGRRRRITLSEPPPATTGEWVMPVQRDPFTVSRAEKLDHFGALNEAVGRTDTPTPVSPYWYIRHRRQEKTFASTDGSFLTQTLYMSHPYFRLFAMDGRKYAIRTYDRLQPVSAGWENIAQPTLLRDIPQLVEETVMMLEGEPIDPDRYDIVFDGYAMGRLVGATIGVASELDRVLGYEANAGGTSYLAPPEDMLGKFQLGPTHLNVRANRSQPGAVNTVKWDDEGFVPDEYQVIKDGVLVDYHTTRDISTELPAAGGRARKSHGCAAAENARNVTLLHTPNLAMVPSASSTTFNDLVGGLEKGLVVVAGTTYPRWSSGAVTTDRQQLNGEVNGTLVYEVRNGKRTRFIRNSEVLFRSPELWKELKDIGGANSMVWTAVNTWKGQPTQEHNYGVGGVPARINRVPVTDRTRQA